MESANHSERPKIFVHEFLIDFLGALVPGILFTIAAIFSLAPILRAIVAIPFKEAETIQVVLSIRSILESTKGTPSAIWVAISIFGLLLSYTLGHLFYRRNPKKPDVESFKRLSNDCIHSNDPIKRTAWLKENLACVDSPKCEFPYPYLYEYLESRGHSHLLSLVTWRGDDGTNLRSKTYINRLKIRLEVYYPQRCRPLIRNEAHVRLASSMWYVGSALWKCSLLGIVIFLGLLAIFHNIPCSETLFPPKGKDTLWCVAWAVQAVLPSIVIICFARYCQYAIERFLLYQRLREVFYVLETAYTCFRDNPDKLCSPKIKISDDLREDMESHRDMDQTC